MWEELLMNCHGLIVMDANLDCESVENISNIFDKLGVNRNQCAILNDFRPLIYDNLKIYIDSGSVVEMLIEAKESGKRVAVCSNSQTSLHLIA